MVKNHDVWLLSQPGIVAVGIVLDPAGSPCLEISTDELPPPTRRAVKQRLKDVPIRFRHTGPINAL